VSFSHFVPRCTKTRQSWNAGPKYSLEDEAALHPELRRTALQILTRVVDLQRQKGQGDVWASYVTGLREHCKALVEPDSIHRGWFITKGQWAQSRMDWSDSQGRGPLVRWQYTIREHASGW